MHICLINAPTVSAIASSTLAFVALGAAFVGIWQIYSSKRHRKIEDFVTLMEFLHGHEFRDARRIVLSPDYKPSPNDYNAWIVCSSFDFAGLMLEKSIVDSKDFLDYWAVPIRELGKRLDGFLFTQQVGDLGGKIYWEHFDWLIKHANKHEGSAKPK
jgi:hypothetical protein